MKENPNIDRETTFTNLKNSYQQYGMTDSVINELISVGEQLQLSYDAIYLFARMQIANFVGTHEYATAEEVAKAFGISVEEINAIANGLEVELRADGKNPRDYFIRAESSRYMM